MGSKITDIQIRHWLRAGEPVAKAQGEVPGLTFTLSAGGTAAWVLRYRLGGKQKELTLGRYPDYGIVAAKAAALEARAKVQGGIDVAREKRQALRTRAADQSFGALCRDYALRVLPTLAPSTQEARRYHINSWLIPRLGALVAKDVNAADVVELIKAAGPRSHAQARHLFVTTTVIFDHGIASAVVASNPCKGISVKAILGKGPDKKDRIKLTEAELRALLPALPKLMNERNAIIVKLLLLTAVRKDELQRAEWEHIDFDRAEWTIPDPHAKKRKGFVIPLPPMGLALFKRLEVLACGSRYVLPSQQQRSAKPTLGVSTMNVALARMRPKLPTVRQFSPHDLRSTARSHLAELGVPLLVAERCLNHSLGGMVAIYDRHDYLTERRAALTTWGDFLECCETGRPWVGSDNVVPIRD